MQEESQLQQSPEITENPKMAGLKGRGKKNSNMSTLALLQSQGQRKNSRMQ